MQLRTFDSWKTRHHHGKVIEQRTKEAEKKVRSLQTRHAVTIWRKWCTVEIYHRHAIEILSQQRVRSLLKAWRSLVCKRKEGEDLKLKATLAILRCRQRGALHTLMQWSRKQRILKSLAERIGGRTLGTSLRAWRRYTAQSRAIASRREEAVDAIDMTRRKGAVLRWRTAAARQRKVGEKVEWSLQNAPPIAAD